MCTSVFSCFYSTVRTPLVPIIFLKPSLRRLSSLLHKNACLHSADWNIQDGSSCLVISNAIHPPNRYRIKIIPECHGLQCKAFVLSPLSCAYQLTFQMPGECTSINLARHDALSLSLWQWCPVPRIHANTFPIKSFVCVN